MKKLFFASLWVLACLTAACSDEKDEPNGESGSVVNNKNNSLWHYHIRGVLKIK